MHFLKQQEALAFVRERADLFDRADNPFAKSPWELHFIEQIVEADWAVVALERDASGPGAMLLYSTPPASADRWVLTNYYASLYSPVIAAPQDMAAATAQLVRQLTTQKPQCATLNLAPLVSDSPASLALERELEANGWYVRRYFAHGNWYMAGMPYEQYLSERDSKARKSKSFAGKLRLVTDPADVGLAMDGYEAIYAKSWKKPEPYADFVRGWARICAARGWLRLGMAYVEGQPIASQFWFTIDGRAYIFKLAYDEEQAKWSAGTLLTALLMRHVLDVDEVGEVDYLTGDDPYKAAWMSQRRERIGLIACNKRTTRGLARAAIEFAGDMRRKALAPAA